MAPAKRLLSLCFQVLALAWAVLANGGCQRPDYVSVSNGSFVLNGKPFFFYGTLTYWLSMLNDAELDAAFADAAASGLNVLRTWAFNDVSKKPNVGNYFQILQDGKATINFGPDGIQRLDKIVAAAQRHNLKVVFTLTNNWNPQRPQQTTAVGRRRKRNNEFPRGFLSNDYGGMDMYVRAFHPGGTHDLFYTDPTIQQAFQNYVTTIVDRFANSSAVLGWEIANDPRCKSSLPASSSCNPQTITKWIADVSGLVKQHDPCHIVTPGDGGFFCKGCPKLFGSSPPHSKRDYSPTGPAYDGSYGVDTEDIAGIPSIDAGTFQLLPDQISYHQDVSADPVVGDIGSGNAWIDDHSDTATVSNVPRILTQFEVLTTSDAASFIPPDMTGPVSRRRRNGGGPTGVTPLERDFTVTSYVATMFNGNVIGAVENKRTPTNSSVLRRVTVFPDITSLSAALLKSKSG